MRNRSRNNERGFVLVITMFLIVVLATLLTAYTTMTRIELITTKGMKNSAIGFNTAEAGLNLRAEAIRASFVGYNRPTGTSPNSANPCIGSNQGTGAFACQTNTFAKQTATSYVTEDPANPALITVPPGERYQNLTAQEYQYTADATATNTQKKVEALLELNFKSRLVPLFQFAAFYNKDLEILPGPTMTLNGPVHTNGDLYMDSGATITVQGQITTAGGFYRGRKDANTCIGNSVAVYNPTTATKVVTACSTRKKLLATDVTAWNNMIQLGVPVVSVPQPEQLDPVVGATYWSKADLRVVLKLDASHNPTAIEVRTAGNALDSAQTTKLMACTGTFSSATFGANKAVNTSYTFKNNRENKLIRMLDVDVRNLLECLYLNNSIISGKLLNENSEGGLVFHFSVSGPDSGLATSRYGIRLKNGAVLKANTAAAPTPLGLTVVTDGAAYVQGDYNSVAATKLPTAVLADSFNVLSNNWNDANSTLALASRVPTATTQQVAVLAGTDTTGGVEGSSGQNGAYNGGLENYPRFHENWNGTITYTYRGSFVSLNKPRHVNGGWVYGGMVYTAPVRNWNYDVSFNSAQNLPPITPRFVYLKQQLFVRDYDQS